MAETKREIERKYENPAADGDDGAPVTLPDLSRVPGVASVDPQGTAELDAVYYDTADQRLADAGITLRRRTGGSDAGWHLKLPVSLTEGVRDEIRAPLAAGIPPELAALVRSRVRGAELVPVVRLVSTREVHHLTAPDGTLLAEASVDRVHAERLAGGTATTAWTEIEVELGDDVEPGLLDTIEKKLKKAGLKRSGSHSKLARALAETAPDDGPRATGARPASPCTGGAERAPEPGTAGDHVLAYLRKQRDAIVNLDPEVRRDAPDAVHQMRVATRRARSAFRSFSKILDRNVTDPVAAELKWLAAELGIERDKEVLTERLTAALDELPPAVPADEAHVRLHIWAEPGTDSAGRLTAVLDGKRYLALLDALDALLAAPPLRTAAAGKPKKALAKAVRRDYRKVAALVHQALGTPAGPERDVAMHEARKKAKRTRYAAEAASDALGTPADDLVSAVKSLQNLLGDHQDSVMARGALQDLAAQAHAAGENAFPYGVLYGREERRAAEREAELPREWKAVRRAARGVLGSG
ncbi:CYTH and CHAD domain-containing protein [Streptomyces sp. NPDC002004]